VQNTVISGYTVLCLRAFICLPPYIYSTISEFLYFTNVKLIARITH